MADLTKALGGPWKLPQSVDLSPEDQLRQAIKDAGMTPPDVIRLDGQIHRFETNGKKGDDAGWYVAFSDGVPAGRFGCWRDEIQQTWRADIGRELTAAESMAQARRLSEARERRNREQQRKHEASAITVNAIWSDAGAASPDHPYLKTKGIDPHGARITGDGRLMLPMFGQDGELSSLQYIDDDGGKKYHPGGKVKGAAWMIGSDDSRIFIAEGFATAATIYEATGKLTVIAYSASNLPDVAAMMRQQYPSKVITIVADNDQSGIGKQYADQASAKHGCRVILPPNLGDANDYKQAGGDLHALLMPKEQQWLIPADDFAKQPAPIRWLVKGWIRSDGLTMIHGPSGGGKTFVVLDWCLHAAAGMDDWYGSKVRPGRIVYLAGEGHHGMRGRVAAWKQHHNIDALDMLISSHGCDLNTPEGLSRVIEAIAALDAPPAMIVVDTLHRFLKGDENSAQDTKTMLDACGEIQREFGCNVSLVHHTGVSDEAQHRARGSSAWKGALDIEISIKPNGPHEPIEIIQRKSKDTELAEPLYVELSPVAINGWLDEDGEQVTSAVLVQSTAPVKVDRKPSKLDGMKKDIECAWFDSGAEMRAGKPYLSRSALQDFYVRARGLKDATVRQIIKPSADGKIICELLRAGVLEVFEHGWIVADKEFASILAITKGN